MQKLENVLDLSILFPVYNEEEQIAETIQSTKAFFSKTGLSWEMVISNDGSRDQTLEITQRLLPKYKELKVVTYAIHTGRGKAIRYGFKVCRGKTVITADIDLTCDHNQIMNLYHHMSKNPHVDVLLGSFHMPGAKTPGVPWKRLLVSRMANHIIRQVLPQKFHTNTCVFRAYRLNVVQSLDLISDGKEIHLEILSQCLTLEYHITEIPIILTSRKKGRSKAHFRSTTISHLIFSLSEKPSLFLGMLGLLLIFFGLLAGLYIVFLWLNQTLNPQRPMMLLTVILILSGFQFLCFGFLGSQITFVHKEILRLGKNQNEIHRKIDSVK